MSLEEKDALDLLEESGLTEKQIAAIAHYVTIKMQAYVDWHKMMEDDLKTEIRGVIKDHRHIENGEVYLPL